jgi:hypothetical protein
MKVIYHIYKILAAGPRSKQDELSHIRMHLFRIPFNIILLTHMHVPTKLSLPLKYSEKNFRRYVS